MKPRSIKIRDDAHWHELRAQHIGGSDLGVLLGVHPSRTILDLWAEKTGKVKPKSLDNDERVYFGKLLEPIVAKATADRTGWTIKKVHRYISGLPDCRLGASLDYEAFCPDRGPGVLECKTADRLEFSKWDEEEGVPLHYQLQLQTYLTLTGKSWGAVAVLIGGNRLEIFEYERREGLAELIEEEVAKFWETVEKDEQPALDFNRDARLIALLNRDFTPGKFLELDPNGRAAELAKIYRESQAIARNAADNKDMAKAELMAILGDAEGARAGKYEISSALIAAKPDWHISITDLGRVITGRDGYRQIYIKEKL